MTDFIGQRFGRLTVVEEAGKYRYTAMWKCRCDCGGEIVAISSNVKRGNTNSCGCYKADRTSETHLKHGATAGDRRWKHASEYRIWAQIKGRCLNPKNDAYSRYGGRGITLHAPWVDDYAAFLAYVGPRPSPEHSIDRINNNGNYEPGNIRWATTEEQNNNTRANRRIEFNGKTLSAAQWAKELRIDSSLIISRLNMGWSAERALTEPTRRSILTFNGVSMSSADWARHLGIRENVIASRLHKGWTVEQTLDTPVRATSRILDLNGRSQSIAQWARELGVTHGSICGRLDNGWSVEHALTTPTRKRRKK